MSHNAFVTVLLAGWLLMFPPLDKTSDPWKVIVNAPILEWEQVGAHDSANACEAARSKGIELAETDWRDTSMAPVFTLQARMSRCVPADHIYPPRK
jgi:hypothetical protein